VALIWFEFLLSLLGLRNKDDLGIVSMTSTLLDRNLDAQLDSELEYKALIRSLKYTQGFGLLFVQCSPPEGERLIAKVRKDLLQKHIEVL
jgi:hypothetical protein